MTQQEFLAGIAQQLEAAGIPFMVAGSIASSFHGQPRATNDIALVIDPTSAQLNNVAVAQWPTLDRAYMRKWAAELDIAASLEEVMTAAEQAQPPAG